MGGGGGAFAEIEAGCFTGGAAKNGVTAAAETAHAGLGDGEDEADGDGGVGGGTSAAENVDAGIGSESVGCGDHRAAGADWLTKPHSV